MRTESRRPQRATLAHERERGRHLRPWEKALAAAAAVAFGAMRGAQLGRSVDSCSLRIDGLDKPQRVTSFACLDGPGPLVFGW